MAGAATDFTNDFQKYLAGEPLNEELAKLKAGEQTEAEEGAGQQLAARAPLEDADRHLTTAERLDLKEIRALPGWGVLWRILERSCRIHDKSATMQAQNDPLKNADAIARAFALAQMYRRAKSEILATVDAEVKELENEQR